MQAVELEDEDESLEQKDISNIWDNKYSMLQDSWGCIGRGMQGSMG